MRVALDATPLLGFRTGVGAFTAGALKALNDRPGLQLSAYALTWRKRDTLAAHVPPGVRAVARPMAARPLRELWCRFDVPPVEWWTGPLEVVHGTNFVVPPTRGAAVVTVHDLTAVRFPELCDGPSRAYPGLLRRALARGAWVHAVSEFTAREAVECLGVDPARMAVVASGVPPVPAGEGGCGARLAGGDRYVLALGTVEPRKGYPVLVQAFDLLADRMADVRLVVAGPSGWGAADLDTAMARLRHGDRVVRLGHVSDRQRADLLYGASVLAYPSRYEGFGFPPLEAMVAGVPVVATAAGSLPEVLGDAALLVPLDEIASLADGLEAAIEDQDERDRLVAAGRRQVAGYSWDRCAEGLVDLYRRAVG